MQEISLLSFSHQEDEISKDYHDEQSNDNQIRTNKVDALRVLWNHPLYVPLSQVNHGS